MATTGLVSLTAPIDPKNGASKAKTPPSDATVQYPPVAGSAAMPTMGLLSLTPAHRPVEAGVAEGEHPAVGRHGPVARDRWPRRAGRGGDADHGRGQA